MFPHGTRWTQKCSSVYSYTLCIITQRALMACRTTEHPQAASHGLYFLHWIQSLYFFQPLCSTPYKNYLIKSVHIWYLVLLECSRACIPVKSCNLFTKQKAMYYISKDCIFNGRSAGIFRFSVECILTEIYRAQVWKKKLHQTLVTFITVHTCEIDQIFLHNNLLIVF